MANKYLSLEGLQAYTKQLYINFPSSVGYDNTSGAEKFTYTTYTYNGDTKTASIHDIVTVADLRTDLALGNYADVDTLTVGSGNTAVTATIADGTATVATLPADALTGTTSTTLVLGNGVTATTQASYDAQSPNLIATTGYVESKVQGIANAMVFKGTVGDSADSPTITALPVNGTANIGDTYKVITDGTYASQSAKAGDVFTCNGKTADANTWVLIPSGDEPTGTVTSVAAGVGLTTVSGEAITESGTIKANLASETALSGNVYSVGVNGSGQLAVAVSDATTSAKGVVQIGTNLDVADGVVSVATATDAVKGVVQVGTNIDVASGVISVKTGSASDKGVLQVGTNLSVADGVVSVATGASGTLGVVSPDNTSITATNGVLTVDTITYSGTNNDIDALFTTGA